MFYMICFFVDKQMLTDCQQSAACQALGLDRITDRSRPHLFIRCQPPAIPPACSGLEMCGYRHKLHISPSPKHDQKHHQNWQQHQHQNHHSHHHHHQQQQQQQQQQELQHQLLQHQQQQQQQRPSLDGSIKWNPFPLWNAGTGTHDI